VCQNSKVDPYLLWDFHPVQIVKEQDDMFRNFYGTIED